MERLRIERSPMINNLIPLNPSIAYEEFTFRFKDSPLRMGLGFSRHDYTPDVDRWNVDIWISELME